MTIVYQTARATLWHGDALDFLATLATESVDLVATDPPYGQEFISNMRTDLFGPIHGDGADSDSRAAVRDILTECVRCVGQHRHVYVFGPDDVLNGLKVSETADLIWDKGRPGMGDLQSSWGPAHEPITFAVSKHRHGGQRGGGAIPARMRKGSVLAFPPPTGRKVRHPSEKPLGLMRELIESSSRVGETVLDPFCGVGSTGVAAVLLGRRCLLAERDDRYISIIRDRLAAAERLADEMATI